MRLSQLLAGHALSDDPEITAVVYDSRRVVPGALFACLPGTQHDGHDWAAAAAKAGAAAILAERPVDAPGATLVVVPSARAALAQAAAAFYGRPAERLKLVGVTGTNGKTTTAYLYDAIAAAAEKSCGVIGTVSYRFGNETRSASHTTPESVELQALLSEMAEAGCDRVVMEVSSHALAQDRVGALPFAAAGFTNLSRDHLDFHADMDDYFAAKAKLFGAPLQGIAVVNGDDPRGRALHERLVGQGRESWRFSVDDSASELHAEDVRISLEGIAATFATPRGKLSIRSPLVGAHNLQNLLCAAGLALATGLPNEAVEKGLAGSSGAPGRLERIDGGGISAFVDYAHTDDALARAAAALREVTTGRLIVVFGCGGDRDKGKRPLMGEAAGRIADLAVVTSDNPRTEDPASIVEMILPGVEKAGRRRLSRQELGEAGYVVEVDRRKAIELAVEAARPGDVILIAGKGHEDYQILGKEKIHFDDREEARRALGSLS